MDYYDFYKMRKEILYQNIQQRLILVYNHREKILVQEYCDYTGKLWVERVRVRFNKNEFEAIKAIR